MSEQLGTVFQQTLERVARAGSQRRCYNGCFPSSDWEFIWSDWVPLSSNVPESRLDFWVELQEYSVSVGGKRDAKYKWVPNNE